MKMSMFAVVSASLVLLGCSQSNSPQASNTNSSGGSPVTAPVDYLSAIAKSQQNAVKTVDTTSIKKAIDLFNVEKGRNPKDLNELVQEKYMPQIPATPYGTKLSYDANLGDVQVVPDPSAKPQSK